MLAKPSTSLCCFNGSGTCAAFPCATSSTSMPSAIFVQEKLSVAARKKPKKAEESEADTLGETLDMGMIFELMVAEFRKDGLLTGFESAANAFKETFVSEGEPDPEK